MKLLAIEMSRLIALFHVARTAGQLYLPHAAAMIAGRYNFSKSPNTYEELTADRTEFNHGEFEGNAIQSLEIYGDGIVISTRSDTDFIDAFFSDFQQWITDELGMSMIKTQTIDRLYESNLIIELEPSVLEPLESFSKIGVLVERALKETTGLEVKYQPFGWAIATDQTQNPSLKPGAFRIERRVGTEFSLQQFVAMAPLKTKQHLIVLKKLEEIL